MGDLLEPAACRSVRLASRPMPVSRQEHIDAVIHLPLVLPPVAIGYGLLVLLGRNGPVGGWLFDTFGLTLAFTWKGAAIASAVVAFP